LDWTEHGLTEDQLNFSARHPLDEELFVDEALRALRAAAVIDAVDYPRDQFDRFRAEVRGAFEHEGRVTHIYPEEERLLFALSWISAPSTAVALGAFYGYAALWLLPGVASALGRMRLIDIDAEALDLAERNFSSFGFAKIIDFDVGDAVNWTATVPVDLCFLDAEGPTAGVPEELRDKAVYGPILRRASPMIRPGGLLIAHNVLDDDLPRTRYLEKRFASYGEQQRQFATEVERSFDRGCVLATTEGTGAYRRRLGDSA
jgi:predicted O-methyltransferase YrrM